MNELRHKIDKVDLTLLKLIEERMDIAREIGQYKKDNGIPVYDPIREKAKLAHLGDQAHEEKREYVVRVFEEIIRQCRTYEEK